MAIKPFETQGGIRIRSGDDIVNDNGDSVLGGGSTAGLTGDISFEPLTEGQVNYQLDIEGQHQDSNVTLRLYRGDGTGNNDLGPAISLGQHDSSTHRAGVIAIGNSDVGYNSKKGGVYIGAKAGWNNIEAPQGEYAIAIGTRAAYTFAHDGTITLNATGENLDPQQADSLYIKPIREVAENTAKALYYNTTTGEVTYADPTGGANLISQSSIQVETGDSDRWFVRLRREDQTVNPNWDGVVVYSTNYDSNGNAIVVARISLNNSGLAVFKFDSSGELIWKKAIGAIDSTYWPEGNAVIDSSDNIILAVNPDDSITKIIVKINGTTGAVIFSRIFDFGRNTNLTAIAVDSASNIIIGGDSEVVSNEAQVAFVAKLNPTATAVTWQRTLNVQYTFSYINTLAVDFNDDIIVGGRCPVEHTVSGSPTTTTVMFVAKITSAGALAWQKAVRLDDINQGDISGISLDSVGNIYATGSYYVDTGVNAPFQGGKSNAIVIFKMTTQGVVVWDRRVGPGECSWVGVSTAVGDDGDLYLYASTYQYTNRGEANSDLGYWNATLALARYNKSTGAVVWQSYFDNPNAQEVPGQGNDVPWGVTATDLMAVKGDKILIGGAVRLGQSGVDQDTPWAVFDYFNQGFLAQFDTAATDWSAEGWTLSTSRIPGKLTNTLTAVTGPAVLATDVVITPEGSEGITAQAAGISVRRTASKVNIWQFGKDGTFTTPADADIRLNQRQLGSANLYGLFPNNEDDIWFESVCHDADGFAYVLGSDQWGNNKAHIYKFTPEGSLVWQRQLFSGSGATFNVEWSGGVYTLVNVVNNGGGYKVGDRIVLPGTAFGGTIGVNSLVLEVASINIYNDFTGGVNTVTIVSGVAPSGTSSANDVYDGYDNAACEVRSMTFDPVTGNPVIVISTPTYNGDTWDNEWSETVVLLIDSGSGTVVSTTTLQDAGDVYPYDVDVSTTGKVAVVGQKFNEYTEYGAITPLAGSAVDKLWVTKADIDSEHFPGEEFSYYSDWWITGNNIADQVQIQSVNLYVGLATTTNSATGGNGATITLEFNANTGAWSSYSIANGGSLYGPGDTITVSGTLLAGGASPTNNIVFTVDSVPGGGTLNNSSLVWVSGAHPSTHLLLTTDASVDYTAVGATFAIKQNLGGEAFIWTPDFNKAIGSGYSDWFSGVAWNAAGTHLYAVGSGRYEVNYEQALVVKFSSAGTIVASKFVNDNLSQQSAYNGAVALMANDSVVVAYQQYNNSRDETDEILVTKLDSNLNILWQQFIGVDSGDGWTSPRSCHSVAVDPATDEILLSWHTYNDDVFGDDAIHIVKLDTDGEVLWKRLFGIHESDTRMCYNGYGNKAVSIHGDQFTLVGYTDGPDDDTDNAFIVTLPLDGTGVGLHGLWTYAEPNDDRIKPWRLASRTSTTFDATVHSNGITAVDNIKYYYTNYPEQNFTLYPQVILSDQGGALEFADGSRQTFSTALVPQVKISAGRYTLRPEDSGRHILIESENYAVVIPFWGKVALPVGFTLTLVNISGNDVRVECEYPNNGPYQGSLWLSGGDMKTPAIRFPDNGSGQMITLIKIKEGTHSNNAESHGDVWMVAGADIINDD